MIYSKSADKTGMETIKIINKILSIYDDALDYDKVDEGKLSYKALKITPNRFEAIMKMLNDKGYIKGLGEKDFIDGSSEFNISESYITLEGICYYAENCRFLEKLGITLQTGAAIVSTVTGIVK